MSLLYITIADNDFDFMYSSERRVEANIIMRYS